MPQRDLVLELSGEDPNSDVLAILANAKAGYYAGVPDENLARDLEALRWHGPEERRADWERGRVDAVTAARRGDYRTGQEIIRADAAAPKADAATTKAKPETGKAKPEATKPTKPEPEATAGKGSDSPASG